MKQQSFFVTMSDGHELFVRTFTPDSRIIGHIHLLHGLAEHSGRYEYFAEKLCEAGYFVSAHDHRGHGYTVQRNGILGYFGAANGFERVVEDVVEVLAHVKQEIPGRPILFGHSMGSFIARRLIQHYSERIDSLILSGTGAPAILHEVGHVVAKQLVNMQGAKIQSNVMDHFSFSGFNRQFKDAKTNFDWLSTDEEEVRQYIADPLCGFIATNQLYVDLTYGINILKNRRENARIRPDLKILLVSGTDDPVGENNAKGVFKSARQLAQAGVEQVMVHVFEGMRHEILHEKKKEQVIEIIVRWLEDE